MSSTPTGNNLLVEIENAWPKLGQYLRTSIIPSIQSRGRAGQVLATPADAPGPVQLQNISDLVSTAGVSQIVAGMNISVTPSSGKGVVTVASTGGGGTVTSVALTVPSWQTVTGSPVTNAGTLAITDNVENANLVFAGPSTGAAAAPAFRALVAADIPVVVPTFVQEVPSGTLNGVNKVFTLSFTPNPTASFVLYSNGVEQIPTTDYTLSTNTITYTVAPQSFYFLRAIYTH